MKRYFLKNKWLFTICMISKVTTALLQVGVAILLKEIIDIAFAKDIHHFLPMMLKATAYFIGMTACFWGDNVLNAQLTKRFSTQVKEDLAKGIFEQSIHRHQQKDIGYYINLLTTHVALIETKLLQAITTMVASSALLIGTFIFLWRIHYQIALIMLASGTLLLFVPRLYLPWVQKRQYQFVKENAQFLETLKDVLQGFEVIKSHPSSPLGRTLFEKANRAIESERLKMVLCRETTNSVTMLVAFACQFSGILSGSYFLTLGLVSAGQVMAVLQLGNNVFNPMQVIANSLLQMKSLTPILNEMHEYLTVKPDCSTPLASDFQMLELKNVSFKYTTESFAIKDITYTFNKNKKYLILGESGSGKSTLLKLLAGYFNTFSGAITLNHSIPYETIEQGTLENIMGVVPQFPYLFKTTLMENVTLNRETFGNLSMKNPALESVLSEIPNGLNYAYGKDGQMLSGGQIQRLGVARELYLPKSVLLLDECASALDFKSALSVEKHLLEKDNTTLIHITHHPKLELIEKYDEILYIHKGQIVFSGTPKHYLNSKFNPQRLLAIN